MTPLIPESIAEPYLFRVKMGTLTESDFTFAMRQAFNAGTLKAGEDTAQMRAEFSRELSAKQAIIDQLESICRARVNPMRIQPKGDE